MFKRSVVCSIPLLFFLASARAEDLVTHEYWLKNTDTTSIIQCLNFAVANPTGKRIMGGQGKHLVVTDAEEQQEMIAELLPVIDQPTQEATPQRVQMELVIRASRFLQQKKALMQLAQKPGASAAAMKAALSSDSGSGMHTYDIRTSTKSVYAEEDAKLTAASRIIEDDPILPSTSGLTLKGIFKSSTGSPLALLAYGNTNFTAHDGGLFERNHTRVKDVTTRVLKDRVIVTGPDKVPREITFISTL